MILLAASCQLSGWNQKLPLANETEIENGVAWTLSKKTFQHSCFSKNFAPSWYLPSQS